LQISLTDVKAPGLKHASAGRPDRRAAFLIPPTRANLRIGRDSFFVERAKMQYEVDLNAPIVVIDDSGCPWAAHVIAQPGPEGNYSIEYDGDKWLVGSNNIIKHNSRGIPPQGQLEVKNVEDAQLAA
jgi:hypothetical protein